LKKRAMNDAAKAERRQTILDTARHLYGDGQELSVPIAEIAAAAGLAKGTFYLYFKNRETLDLALLQETLGRVFDALDFALEKGQGAGAIPGLLCNAAMDSLLVRLGSRYNLILEGCGDYEAVVDFKEYLNLRMEKSVSAMAGVFPGLRQAEILELLIGSFSTMIGLWQMAEPAGMAKDILAARGLRHLQVDFSSLFPRLVQDLWTGALLRCEKNNP
jgi:AcrR family transcriptional regulator